MWFCFLNRTPLPSAFNLIFVGAKMLKIKLSDFIKHKYINSSRKRDKYSQGGHCCKPQFYTVQFVIFYAPQKATLIRWDIYHTHLELLLKGILGLGLSCTHKRDATKKDSSEIPSFVFPQKSVCLHPNMGLIDCCKSVKTCWMQGWVCFKCCSLTRTYSSLKHTDVVVDRYEFFNG